MLIQCNFKNLLAQEICPGLHQVVEGAGGSCCTTCWTESQLRRGSQAWLGLHRSWFGFRGPQDGSWRIGAVEDGFHISDLGCLNLI